MKIGSSSLYMMLSFYDARITQSYGSRIPISQNYRHYHITPLQLLVFELTFQFLRLSHLANRLVEVVLVDSVPVVLDGEQTTVSC